MSAMDSDSKTNNAAHGGRLLRLVLPLRDALALVDFGPCKTAARPQDWVNVASPMCAHCEGVEDVNLAAARIIAAEYRAAADKVARLQALYDCMDPKGFFARKIEAILGQNDNVDLPPRSSPQNKQDASGG